MSTRSAIGVQINGKIHAVYVHWDGYPSGVGKTLVENYGQREAEYLVEGGDISSLGKTVGFKHPFDTYGLSDEDRAKFKDMTTYYRRDRGEYDDNKARELDSVADFIETFGGEYWYLLGTDGVWYVSTGRVGDWESVSIVLAAEAETE